jgi:hypothetical protein
VNVRNWGDESRLPSEGASAISSYWKVKLPKDWVQVDYEKPAACPAIVMRERGRRAVGEIGGKKWDERGWRPDSQTIIKGRVDRGESNVTTVRG